MMGEFDFETEETTQNENVSIEAIERPTQSVTQMVSPQIDDDSDVIIEEKSPKPMANKRKRCGKLTRVESSVAKLQSM
jgi:hypothetical protein